MNNIFIFLIVLFFICVYLYFHNNSISVKQYNITIKNLSPDFEGFTILHLTDLHGRSFGYKQKKLLKEINNYNYDLVAITGDMVKKRKFKLNSVIDLIQNIKNKPIYFVSGNHEMCTNIQTIKETLLNLGVNVLQNDSKKVLNDNNYIWIVGVDDPYTNKSDINKALDKVDDANPKILLAHSPHIYPNAKENNIDLVLVGHTHGGEIRIPFYGGLLIEPKYKNLPRLDCGLYKYENTNMIINKGLGTSIFPFRINNKPELDIITLTANS